MEAGVPGRPRGKGGEAGWTLKEKAKGFGGGHGSRHLYNMMGGKVLEVDVLIMVKTAQEDEDLPRKMEKNPLKLEIPCLAADSDVAVLFVPQHEAELLAKAIDHLPRSNLSWSLHRGLRDMLLAYGTPVMDRYRGELANLLKNELKKNEVALVDKGWDADFVHGPMADIAASAVLSGRGNSGDVVRVVVAIVEVSLEGSEYEKDVDRDLTAFWRGRAGRREVHEDGGVIESVEPFSTEQRLDLKDMDMAVALTNFFCAGVVTGAGLSTLSRPSCRAISGLDSIESYILPPRNDRQDRTQPSTIAGWSGRNLASII